MGIETRSSIGTKVRISTEGTGVDLGGGVEICTGVVMGLAVGSEEADVEG